MYEGKTSSADGIVLKIGQIGCGNWGKNILRDLLKLNCEVFVVDTDQKKRQRAVELGASESFSDIHDLPECDGYIVAVPIPDLTKECIRLLPFKKPIFSEKTLLIKPDDFDTLKNHGGIDYVFLMHKWHYHPGIDALRNVSDSGILGNVEAVFTIRHGWVENFHGGDVFWTQSVHDLTIVKHILGYIPSEVKAIKVIENEEGLPVSFNAILGDKPSVFMSVSGNHCNKISGVSIQGKKGSASLLNAYDDHITIRTKDGEKKVRIDTTFPLYIELNEFTDYLKGGTPPRYNLHNAKEVTDMILKLKDAV